MLLGAPARFAIDRAGGPGIAGCCRLSAAAAFTASAHAAAHSRGCTNRTAAAFSRSCTSQSRALACRESANRTTFPDTAAPLADVRGRALIATVEAALAHNIDTNRDAAVAISVVIVVIIPIGATVAIHWGVVAVRARGVGIAINTRLSIAVAIVPIAGPSCASGKGEESQRGSGYGRKFAHQVYFLTSSVCTMRQRRPCIRVPGRSELVRLEPRPG